VIFPLLPLAADFSFMSIQNPHFQERYWEPPRGLRAISGGGSASHKRPDAFPTCPHSPNYSGLMTWFAGLTHSILSELKNLEAKERCWSTTTRTLSTNIRSVSNQDAYFKIRGAHKLEIPATLIKFNKNRFETPSTGSRSRPERCLQPIPARLHH